MAAATANATMSTAAAAEAKGFKDPVVVMALDGETLTPEMLVHIGYGQPHSAFRDGSVQSAAGLDKHFALLVPVTKPPSEQILQPQNKRDPALTAPHRVVVILSPEAWTRVRTGRAVVDRVLARREVAYGINTGFGNFANVIIGDDKLKELQCNLIRSHASGVGQPLTLAQTRMLMALRANVLAKGHSGVREETLNRMLAALNANCLPLVPCKGSVGASGDLAPLSHLALGLMGEGLMWDPTLAAYANAAQVLARHGLKPIELQAKEGLALINGTQLITSIAAEAVVRAKRIARQADVVAAMTLEALRGSVTPFHPSIHASLPHRGQGMVAARVRAILTPPSEIMNSHHNCGKVQDSYTLRCVPQIHGISHDSIAFCYGLIQTECNSATDNPMIFASLHRDTIPASPSFSAQPVPLFDGTVPSLPVSAKHAHHHHHLHVTHRHTGSDHAHVHSHGPAHHQAHVQAPAGTGELAHYVAPAPNAAVPHSTPHPTRTLITGSTTLQFSTDCSVPHTTTGLVGAAAATVLQQQQQHHSGATQHAGSKRKAVVSASDSDSDASSIASASASASASGKSMFGATAGAPGKAGSGGGLALLSGLSATGTGGAAGSSIATPSPSFSPQSSASTPPHTPPLVPARGISGLAAAPSAEKKLKADPSVTVTVTVPAPATAVAGGKAAALQPSSPMKVDAKGDPAAVKAGDLNDPRMGVILSGGNFHGEYPAKAADFLAIGVHELCSVSERRIERLVNPQLSSLPAFLTDNGGLNSGFMIAHCAAASLVSENKVLCHPSSVDSLSTSAAQEDHVSMGGFAARKALTVVEHVETVIAIELLAAAQAMDYLRPLKSTPSLEAVHKVVRCVVPKWTSDRFMSPDIEAVIALLQSERVWNAVAPHVDTACHE